MKLQSTFWSCWVATTHWPASFRAITAAGYSLLDGVSASWLSAVQAFGGGAVLMMLANTMIPEAYGHGGKLAGVFTVLGFGVSVWIVMLEHAAAGPF